MTTPRRPSDLELQFTREFQAPLALVFDVLTKPEHLAKTIAPFGETVTTCEIDPRVGGAYHYVFVTPDGIECSFRGTFLEFTPPDRTVQTWHFDGWPDVEAVESFHLEDIGAATRMQYTLAFQDQAGRDHMRNLDGLEANFDNIADYLRTLVR